MDFDQFRELVIRDSELMKKLTRCASETELFAEVLAISRGHGFELHEQDLAAIVRTNRRLWLERWTLQ